MKAILEVLRAGGTHSSAHAKAGIHRDTYAEWRKKDKAFAFAVEQAMEEGNLRLALRINQAAEPRKVTRTTTRVDAEGATVTTTEEFTEAGDWRAALRILEVRDPENWAKKVKLEKDGDSIKGYGAGVDFDDL